MLYKTKLSSFFNVKMNLKVTKVKREIKKIIYVDKITYISTYYF